MNSKTLNLITLFLLLFLGASVYFYANSIKGDYATNYGEMVTVLRIKERLGIFELDPITSDRLEPTEIPKKIAPINAIKDLSELKGGAVAAIDILPGQTLTKTMIVYRDKNNAEILARKVAIGKRALTIPVNELGAVGRMFLPGDRIDIAFGVKTGDTRCDRDVKFIFEDLMVLAVGTKMINTITEGVTTDERSGQKNRNFLRAPGEVLSFSTATLEVTPEQAQVFGLLAGTGELEELIVVLRNAADRSRTETKSVNIVDIVPPEKRDKVCNAKTTDKTETSEVK